MSTTNIQLLRSNIVSKRPAASILLDGQVAVNYNFQEPGLFFRLTDGKLTKVGPVAYTNDGSVPNAMPAGEPGNAVGEEWLDGRLSFYKPILKVFDGTNWTPASGFGVDDATGNFTLERALTVTELNTTVLNINGPLTLSHDLLAADDCQQNIGSELSRFFTAWFCYADVKHNFKVGETINARDLILTQDYVARDGTLFGDLRVGSGSNNSVYINGHLDVQYSTTLRGNLEVKENTLIGSDCSQTLSVKATSVFDCPVTFNSDVNFGTDLNDLTLLGDTVIGDGCATSTLLIQAATTVKCDILADPDNTVNLGSPTKRFANIYTGDLHFSNEGSGGNDVDGTTGNWTLQEGDESMFFINNKTGMKFRVVMEPVG